MALGEGALAPLLYLGLVQGAPDEGCVVVFGILLAQVLPRNWHCLGDAEGLSLALLVGGRWGAFEGKVDEGYLSRSRGG